MKTWFPIFRSPPSPELPANALPGVPCVSQRRGQVATRFSFHAALSALFGVAVNSLLPLQLHFPVTYVPRVLRHSSLDVSRLSSWDALR